MQHSGCETDSRPLDDLIAFIEGDEEGEGGGVMVTTATNTSKATKKKKKAKKVHINFSSNSVFCDCAVNFHSNHHSRQQRRKRAVVWDHPVMM